MRLAFEPASAADIMLIRNLAEQIWHGSYMEMLSTSQIRYMLDWMYAPQKLEAEIERGVNYFIVREERQAVGYLAWELIDAGFTAYLNKLYLLPEHQGRGMGQAMLNRFFEEALQARATQAELRVNRANARALKAYDRSGFQIVETRVTEIGAGYVMDDFILRRALPASGRLSETDGPSCE